MKIDVSPFVQSALVGSAVSWFQDVLKVRPLRESVILNRYVLFKAVYSSPSVPA